MVTLKAEVNWEIPLHDRQIMLGWPPQVLASEGTDACDVNVEAGVPEIDPDTEAEIDTDCDHDTVPEVDQDTVPEVDQDTVPEPEPDVVPDTVAASMLARHDSKTAITTKAFRDILLVPE
jgi:hypothetical protein